MIPALESTPARKARWRTLPPVRAGPRSARRQGLRIEKVHVNMHRNEFEPASPNFVEFIQREFTVLFGRPCSILDHHCAPLVCEARTGLVPVWPSIGRGPESIGSSGTSRKCHFAAGGSMSVAHSQPLRLPFASRRQAEP